jgi:threonine/homoserine/homoserine lactone efflux protein
MSLLADWLTIFLVSCLAVMSPGPNLAVLLRNSLLYSRKTGVFTATNK